MKRRCSMHFIAVMCASFLYVGQCFAAVTTVQALDFGTWILTNNDAQYDLILNTDGSYSSDPEFIEISPPQVGIYDIDSLTPGDPVVSVTVTQAAPMFSTGFQSFSLVNMQDSHPANVDGFGVLRVTVGGTARSSGGGLYGDRTYNGSIDITLNF